MTARWRFNELRPGDKTREPTQGEFFATDAIRDPAEALIREAIQNSLDAGDKDAAGNPIEEVHVRISLATGEHALPPSRIEPFFRGIWPHLKAEGNGLRTPPTASERCPFLVFEDFGTSGLTGDVHQWHDIPGVKNSFFYFFRAEGRTGKGGEDRGRWGVGKYVFPRSSRANSFLAVTVPRDNPRPLLMGQAVLKTHACGQNHYKPDGGFGVMVEDLIVPVEEEGVVDAFLEVFSVSRRNQPGLSIVVPWVDPEITRDSLLRAVVYGYFHPILEGKLSVTVAFPEHELEINDSTLADVIESVDTGLAAELLPLVHLAEWASNRKPSDYVAINPAPTDRPTWSARDLISPAVITRLQADIERGDRIALKIPLVIRANKQSNRDSYFHLFLEADGETRERTVFVREGIIISDVRPRRVHGIRSLVVVDHKPLATLLGDSENPAHTQWQKDSSNFRDKYPKLYGKSVIDYVTHCVSGIMAILSSQQREEDKNLLKDYFSLPAPPQSEIRSKSEKRKGKKGDNPADPPDPPEPRRRRYRLHQVDGGFRISPGDPDATLPDIMEIETAYDVRRGNPFRKYNQADFDLQDASFTVETRGIDLQTREHNRLVIKVRDSDFLLTVTGFDKNRDVCVNVQAKELIDVAEI